MTSPTKKIALKLHFILIILFLFLLLNYDQFTNLLLAEIIVLVLLFEIMTAVIIAGSFFSSIHEDEGKLEKAMRETSYPIKIFSWILIALYPLLIHPIIPYPSLIGLMFILYSWTFMFLGIFNHDFPTTWIAWIMENESNSFIGKLNKYLLSLHFYPSYTIFTRIRHLPFLIRKPIAFIVFLGWTILILVVIKFYG